MLTREDCAAGVGPGCRLRLHSIGKGLHIFRVPLNGSTNLRNYKGCILKQLRSFVGSSMLASIGDFRTRKKYS